MLDELRTDNIIKEPEVHRYCGKCNSTKIEQIGNELICPDCGYKVELNGKKECKVYWWDRAWVWLDGKKTKIGLYVAGAGALSVCVGMIVFPPLIPLGKAIGYIGTATFGGGLVHKFFKGKIKYSNGEAKELGQLITETLTVFYGWIQFITHLKKKGGE
uniref:Uncharacterized protein n=1 Tax=viral metagenome TaxID=1070528 RepID=A0A6M3L6Z7_9ZZZZ